eukprot:1104386-Prorocentrum_minimum.AAC.1
MASTATPQPSDGLDGDPATVGWPRRRLRNRRMASTAAVVALRAPLPTRLTPLVRLSCVLAY